MEWLVILGAIWIGYSVIKHFVGDNSSKSGSYYHNKTYMPKPKLNIKQVDLSDVTLSPEQQRIFDLLETTNDHRFITGKAGTGKSLLLQFFKQKSKKKMVVVAPTGVAALNVGGQTIHSLFRIKPDFIRKESLTVSPKTALLLRNIDAVVIDEISMVRADLMDAVDFILRKARNSSVPFGGVQMIMFGDLYQLPPVVNDRELHKYFADNHGGYYFFNADAWKNTLLSIHELTTVFRQKDENFKEILNAIRKGQATEEVLKQLNVRSAIEIPEDGIITLATTNSIVNEINSFKLNKINEKVYEYRAEITGKIEESAYPTEELLHLKKGAQVMFLKNDKEKRWVNGSIGFVDSLSENEIKINLDGYVYPVNKETWNKVRYYYEQSTHSVEQEVVSSFTQYPLRLAWAITVHKSQGQTYGTIAVDMGDGAFAHGQTYVALSRCKSLEGLYLKREILREDIIVDQTIVNFMSKAEVLIA